MILINGGTFFSGGGTPTPWFKRGIFEEPVLNLAKFGSSNERIFRTTLASILQQKPDVAVIEWTAPERKEIINRRTYHQVNYPPSNNIVNGKYRLPPFQPAGLMEEGDREMFKAWLRRCNEPIQDVTKSLQYIYSLRTILESMDVPYLFYFWRKQQFEAINYGNVSEISHWNVAKKKFVTNPSKALSREKWFELTPELNNPDTVQFLEEAGVPFNDRGLPNHTGHAAFAEKFKVDLANVRNQ